VCCRNMGQKRIRNVELHRYLMVTFVRIFMNTRLYNKQRRKTELDRTVKGNRLGFAKLRHAAFAAVPISFILLPHQCLYIVKNMCIYTHTHPTAYKLYMNHRCYQIMLRVKQFYTNRHPCHVLTGYLSLGCRPGGDWANM